MKKCADVMTRNPVCCLPDETAEKVAQLMRDRNIGPIPVIENEKTKKLVGIVTDRDLVLEVVAKGRDPQNTQIEDVMTQGVVTCRAEDSLSEVLDVMSEYQLRRIPVVDNDLKVIGIISQADVAIRLDEPEKTAKMVKEISQANVFALRQ
jgi:CBS domain-containing protein